MERSQAGLPYTTNAYWIQAMCGFNDFATLKMADKRIKDSEIGTLLEVIGITDTEQLTKNILSFQTTDVKMSYIDFMAYVDDRNLNNFLSCPWLLTLLINLWMDKTFLSGSLCEINKKWIDILINKGLEKERFTQPFLSENEVSKRHDELIDALASVAFNYTFVSEKSLVLNKKELLETNILSPKQLEFAIKVGILNERYCSSISSGNSQVSFVHETLQEYFAAYHIAHSPDDTIKSVLSKNKYNVFEMSQVIIYLSGLKCDVANTVINYLIDDVLNDVNNGHSKLIRGSLCVRTNLTLKETIVNNNRYLNYSTDINVASDLRGLVLSVLLQKMMIACFHEAAVSRQTNICLQMRDFAFHAYLNKNENNYLSKLLKINKSNVRSLILARSSLQENDILAVLQQSKHCIERLKTPGSRKTCSELYHLNLKELTYIGSIDAPSLSSLLPTLTSLTFLRIEESDFKEEDCFQIAGLQYLCLLKSRCSAEFVGRLLVDLSRLDHPVRCNLDEVYKTENTDFIIAELRPLILKCDLSKLHICVRNGTPELFDILCASSLYKIQFDTAAGFVLASYILPTLNKLQTIDVWGIYMGRFDVQLPALLQCICLQECECSSDWLFSLLITLSTLDHPVKCELWNIVLKPCQDARGDDSHIHDSDLRSDILPCDMSNIYMFVKNGSHELFEILRDTSIGILDLGMAECASLASEIIHTLNKLTKLCLRGIYSGRCDFKLPASLQRIILHECECSSEWMCSLLMTLSTIDHPVKCDLWDFIMQSSVDAYSPVNVSDFRSEILSHDMSNIHINGNDCNMELRDLLRDTSIGILDLI